MPTTIANRCNERLSRVQCLSGNQLKMIAVICMLIDHVAVVFYGNIGIRIINPMLASGQMTEAQLYQLQGIYDFLRGIGRIAFPIFAFMFTEGYAHTHSKGRYLARLAVFAVITEFFFDATFFYGHTSDSWQWYWGHQNVFVTYLQALCTLLLMEQAGRLRFKPLTLLLQGITLVASCFLADYHIYGDYEDFGILFIVVAYLLRKNRLIQLLGMFAVKFVMDGWVRPSIFQFYLERYEVQAFLVALVLILLYNGKRGEKNMKPFFYWFYTGHIALLGLVERLICSVVLGL